MRSTSHGLTVWDNVSDNFDHTELAANWDLIDSYWAGFDTGTQLPNRIATVTVLPASPTAGQLVMPIVNIGSLPAYVLARYDGAQWLPVGIASIQGTLPSSPVAGQIVVLSAATSNFAAWSTVRYDGTQWDHVGAFGYINTGSGATNIKGAMIAGDVYVNTAARGVVLVDRITGLKYRLYVNNTALTLESVT